jgi:hypothetical protein
MERIINLEPRDYYTQRNNHIDPVAACMPTARVMFYRGNGVVFDNPSDYQDDDYFFSKMQSDEAQFVAEEKYPELTEAGFPPQEIHGMYHTYLDPEVVGERVSDFETNLMYADFVELIQLGQIVMTSGSFPEAGIPGHAFCVIGLIGPVRGPFELIIADPWGDYKSNYESRHGYGVVMPREDFERHVKPGKKKWGHVLI